MTNFHCYHKPDHIPAITVIVNGGWSKHTHGHSYNAKLGVVQDTTPGSNVMIAVDILTAQVLSQLEKVMRSDLFV